MGRLAAPSRLWRSFKQVLVSPWEEADQRHLAERALDHGDLDAAIDHYNRALAAGEDDVASPLAASTLIRRGSLYLLRDHSALALEDYDQVIDLLQAELDRFRMSLEIVRQGEHQRLTQLLRRTRVRDLRLMLAMVYHNRTIAWQLSGDHDKARAAALKAIEYSPDYVVRLYHQGPLASDQAGGAGRDRRLFNRVQARLQANYGLGHVNPMAPQALRGATEDISASGVKLKLSGEHEVENRAAAQVRLASELYDGRVILPAKVNWVAPDQAAPQTVVGVQLLGVDLTQWDEWLKILTRHAVEPGPDEA